MANLRHQRRLLERDHGYSLLLAASPIRLKVSDCPQKGRSKTMLLSRLNSLVASPFANILYETKVHTKVHLLANCAGIVSKII